LTNYLHGGQIIGIPFAIMMFITTVVFSTAKKEAHQTFAFIFGVIYFFSLTGFSVTIERIRDTNLSYFQYLYAEPSGVVDEILLGWIVAGILTLLVIPSIKKRSYSRQLLNKHHN
jgi:uncharacterized membrane protein YhaH (DUF805 family)